MSGQPVIRRPTGTPVTRALGIATLIGRESPSSLYARYEHATMPIVQPTATAASGRRANRPKTGSSGGG